MLKRTFNHTLKRTKTIMLGLVALLLMGSLAACSDGNQTLQSANQSNQPAAVATSTAVPTAASTTVGTTTTAAPTTTASATGDGSAVAATAPIPKEMAESNQNPEQAEMVEQGYRTTQQAAARSQDFVYIVVRGDTLSGIAAYYKTTVDAIVQANGIADPNVLYAGQHLVIPGATQPGKTLFYVAQYGDTLYKLARRYGTTVEAIASANNIADPNVLRVGQRLVIPGATQPGNVKVVYIVQYGDTLSGIAAYYGTTVSQIAGDNHLANANQIYVGQRLVIRSA